MSNQLLHALVSAMVVLAMSTDAAGAESSAQAHPCASVTDPAKRLPCYDAAFPPATDTADLESERERTLREFGLNQVQLREREPERMRDTSPDSIEATVSGVSYRQTGERVLTLDSGQVWMLTEVTSKGHLVAGDRVVIREAALGSYMLRTPGRVSLRARRIR